MWGPNKLKITLPPDVLLNLLLAISHHDFSGVEGKNNNTDNDYVYHKHIHNMLINLLLLLNYFTRKKNKIVNLLVLFNSHVYVRV